MITSAEEFVALRESSERTLYMKATDNCAPEEVSLEVMTTYPLMRKWVAHNKIFQTIFIILSRKMKIHRYVQAWHENEK